jgi:hypothetical protein
VKAAVTNLCLTEAPYVKNEVELSRALAIRLARLTGDEQMALSEREHQVLSLLLSDKNDMRAVWIYVFLSFFS